MREPGAQVEPEEKGLVACCVEHYEDIIDLQGSELAAATAADTREGTPGADTNTSVHTNCSEVAKPLLPTLVTASSEKDGGPYLLPNFEPCILFVSFCRPS